MTSFQYPATAATAARLLERFGAAATLKRQSGTTYDPTTGTSTQTYTSYATTAAVFNYAQKYIDGTLIQAGDKQAYCAPAVTPEQGDRFTWDVADYTVVDVKAVAPAGVPVLYEVQLRG